MKRLTVVLFAALLCAPVFRAAGQETSRDPKGLTREGVQLYNQGHYGEAVQKFDAALGIDPGFAEALYQRGRAFLAEGESSKCLQDVDAGLRLHSSRQADFYNLGGLCSVKQWNYKTALQFFQTGLKEFPRSEKLHFNLADLEYKAGKDKEAVREYKQVLSLNPGNASAVYNLALLYQKNGYLLSGMFMDLRYLMLEPYSDRSQAARVRFLSEMVSSLPRANGGGIAISFPSNKDDREGDFSCIGVDMAMTGLFGNGGSRSMANSIDNVIRHALLVASESKNSKLRSTFLWKQALSPLLELKGAHLFEAFLYKQMDLAHVRGSKNWLKRHRRKMEKLEKWFEDHGAASGRPEEGGMIKK